MSRKVEKGNVSNMNSTRSVSWSGGRRTVTKSFVKTDKNGEVRRVTTSSSFNILGIVLCILLFASVAAILTGSDEPKTFGGFLEMLTTVPEVSIPWDSIDIVGLTLPDWLSWAQPALSFFQSLVTVGTFLVNGIWQAIKIGYWIIRWLFF